MINYAAYASTVQCYWYVLWQDQKIGAHHLMIDFTYKNAKVYFWKECVKLCAVQILLVLALLLLRYFYNERIVAFTIRPTL